MFMQGWIFHFLHCCHVFFVLFPYHSHTLIVVP